MKIIRGAINMKLIKNFSLLKVIVMEFLGINIFPMTKKTIACPKARKST